MSIANEIQRLQGAKADLKTAIEGKGVTVPSSAKLDDYPDLVNAIEQSSGIPRDVTDIEVTYADSALLRTNGVSVPAGYYEDDATILPAFAEVVMGNPYVEINSDGSADVSMQPTSRGFAYQSKAYGATQQNAVRVKSAQTYTPTTTDQTISADQYLTGAQTILGDADLIASNIKSGVTIFGVTGTYSGGGWVEQTISDSGAVTQALDPYVLYHFTGALTSLTITLNAPSAGQIAHYHFDFESGSTAPTLTMPNTVTMPDSFAVEASKRYEVDVLNNYGSVIAWTA